MSITHHKYCSLQSTLPTVGVYRWLFLRLSEHNRFFNNTKEFCPLSCPFFHRMHFVVQYVCGYHKVFQQQILSFKPHIDAVLSKSKCSFSLLISKQGFQKNFEIALFSTVLQRSNFSPPQLLCLHTIHQSSAATLYFIPTAVVVEASVLSARSTFHLYSIFSFPLPYSIQVWLQVQQTDISSVTEEISQDEQVTDKWINTYMKGVTLLHLWIHEIHQVHFVSLKEKQKDKL